MFYREFSDHELDCDVCPYDKKYNISCIIDFGAYKIIRRVSYSKKEDVFYALRKLVRLKHDAVDSGPVGLTFIRNT